MRLECRRPAALNVLIESLNEDGYLADPLEEIAERWPRCWTSPAKAARNCWTACSCALRWLQSLEPAGVGARNLASAWCCSCALHAAAAGAPVAITICRAKYLELLARAT
jgi:RNA polymerase sigma-54 factor